MTSSFADINNPPFGKFILAHLGRYVNSGGIEKISDYLAWTPTGGQRVRLWGAAPRRKSMKFSSISTKISCKTVVDWQCQRP